MEVEPKESLEFEVMTIFSIINHSKLSKIILCIIILLAVFHVQDFLKLCCFINLVFWVMDALEMLALV